MALNPFDLALFKSSSVALFLECSTVIIVVVLSFLSLLINKI